MEDQWEKLRQRAQELLRSRSDGEAVLHEMDLLHAELELQNQELVASQRELEELQARYREIFELSPVAQLRLDARGCVTDLNAAAVELLAEPRRNVEQHPFSIWIAPEDRAAFGELESKVASSLAAPPCDLQLRRRGGLRVPVEIHARAVPPTAIGQRPGLLLTVLDTTRRRRAEVALANTQEQYRGTFEGSRDGILLFDARSLEILDANPAACALLGASREALLAIRRTALFHVDSAASQEHGLQKHLRAPGSGPVRVTLETAAGEPRDVELETSSLQIGDRLVLHTTVRDLRRLDAAWLRQRELEQRVRELEQQNGREGAITG